MGYDLLSVIQLSCIFDLCFPACFSHTNLCCFHVVSSTTSLQLLWFICMRWSGDGIQIYVRSGAEQFFGHLCSLTNFSKSIQSDLIFPCQPS